MTWYRGPWFGSGGGSGDGTAPTGSLADVRYVHTQSVASSVWVIPHNLGKFPSITIVDDIGEVIEGDCRFDSDMQVTLNFSADVRGKAFLN